MANQWWARAVVGRTSVSDPLQASEQPDARYESEWRSLVKIRLLVLLGILALWAVGLEARLVYLQVISHQDFLIKAQAQQQDVIEPEAPRGDIVDRNGKLLAYSVDSFDVYANPSYIRDAPVEARELCRALGDCTAADLAQITTTFGNRRLKQVILRKARDTSPDAATGVQALIDARAKALKDTKNEKDYKGALPTSLWLAPRTWRYYPKLDLAAQVVGFITADGKGGAGVESRFNEQIRGVNGRVLAQVDGKTQEMFTRVERAPTQGASLELTIDVGLQHFAERELAAGVLAAGAKSGSVVVLDPYTGEILVDANYPTFNPNLVEAASKDALRNRSAQDTFEPGSTMKIATAAAAINEGVFNTSQLIDTNPGILVIPGRDRPIHEDQGHNYHVLSFEDVIVKSSNVGAAKIGLQVGSARMLQYLQRMGFGQRIAPDFAGESPGQVARSGALSDSALASISMGYEIGVTPIQMAAAASIVANGGLLMEPHIRRAEIRNGRRTEIAPRVIGRAFSPETALVMTSIMEDVVERGTGKPAALDLYRVAGKTGTAAKIVNHRYSLTDYNVSFVGFVPSRRPVFTILVVLDTPTKVRPYGGSVAGPIFKRIAEAALQYAGVSPSVNPIPPIVVAADRPRLPLEPMVATVTPPTITKVGGQPVMADVRGLTMRDALSITNKLGLSMTIDGDGVVVSQTPAPGAPIDPSGRGTLQLRRGPAKSGGSDR